MTAPEQTLTEESRPSVCPVQVRESVLARVGAARPHFIQSKAPFVETADWTGDTYVIEHFVPDATGYTDFTPKGGLSPKQLQRAKEIMAYHYSSRMTLELVAQACNVSLGHFAREFKRSTGDTPHRWICKQKTSLAAEMLVGTKLTLKQIAVACGFVDESHLGRWFKRLNGMTPTQYRVSRSRQAT